MDWSLGEALIIPALWALFQALKRIEVIEANAQYIPLAAVLLGILVSLGWAVNTGLCAGTCQFEAILRGAVYGMSASGFNELTEIITERKSA